MPTKNSITPTLSFEHFCALAKPGTVVPVFVTLLGDHLTPVTAYERLAKRSPYSFLLESVVGGERIARYSFLGAGPRTVIKAFGHRVTLSFPKSPQQADKTFVSADPLHDLQAILSGITAVPLPELPAFSGGAVGYAGYDTVRYLEPEKLASPPPDLRHLPDLIFGLYDDLVIFDHVQKTILVVADAHIDGQTNDQLYQDAAARINAMVESLREPVHGELEVINLKQTHRPSAQSNFTREGFEAAVETAKEFIKAGDIFQVVLSQCFTVKTPAHPFDIYRALRVINPSPFMFYLTAPECTLVGSSPEIMCRVQNGVITSRPLAGTRRRGQNASEDADLEKELLADPKERAEHIMLVDLGRNDVGRVATPGSVKTDDVMSVERYSHVMHITSNVTGELAAGKNCFDALRATLPVGTVSGAPKIRAMQIIDQLEPSRRGPYGGAVGYMDYSGNMDTCIALRTMVVLPPKGDAQHQDQTNQLTTVFVQSGGGLVADSVPASEYQETLNKAAGLLKAVGLAERGFS